MSTKTEKYANIAYTFAPKQKDPFTGEWETRYFVPAESCQRGKQYNYIIITCSPFYNGVWQYEAKNVENYKRWINGKTVCLYVPIADCKKIKELDELENAFIIADIKKQQTKWWKNEVKNRDYEYKRGKPSWML